MAKNSLKVIVVTGTPGTGKSVIAKRLSLFLDYAYLSVSALKKKANLAEKYDKRRKTAIVDPSLFTRAVLKVRDSAAKKGKKGLIVDSHLSHFLPNKAVSACVVLSCSIPELKRRLTKRGYGRAKVRENLDAEIFDVILVETTEKAHRIIKFDATKVKETDIKKLANRIKKL